MLNVHSDRTHARTTSAVRDTEGLVQVEVRHIGAVVSGTTQPNLDLGSDTMSEVKGQRSIG